MTLFTIEWRNYNNYWIREEVMDINACLTNKQYLYNLVFAYIILLVIEFAQKVTGD